MTSVVVDASVALKWVLNEELSLEAHTLFSVWKARNAELVAPDLFLYEVAHVLYRQQRSGSFTLERSWFAFLNVREQVTVRALTPQVTFRAFQIGNATGRPDAYAAFAEDEGCEYWTADERFWNATKALFPYVRWLGEMR